MKQLLSTLPRNIIACFQGRRIIWHVFAIALTFILVASGFDWRYFLSTRAPSLRSWMFPAVHLGGLLPIILPLVLLAFGSLTGSARTRLVGWAVGQAEVIGGLLAASDKAIIGPSPPPHKLRADMG